MSARRVWKFGVGAAVAGAALGAGYVGLLTGRLTFDLNVGRRTRPLGPLVVDIAAPRAVVFEVIAQPYLSRATHAQSERIRILERGKDMVLAAHYTQVNSLIAAATVETVRFTPPERVDFRLVRGPVPCVVEDFVLIDQHGQRTRLEYHGHMDSDLWWIGRIWSDLVADRWNAAVAESFESIKVESERRAAVVDERHTPKA